MQRAAAASPTSASPTTTAQTPSTEPSAKRRRIESTASSPAGSTPGTPSLGPGTPSAANETHTPGLTAPRGGISTFSRGDEADTEWVLDLKLPFPDGSKPAQNGQKELRANEVNGSRFSSIHGLQDQDSSEDDVEEEDIWANQPSGRQIYGLFKQKRKTKAAQTKQQENGDLSSGSDDSDADSGSDNPDHAKSHHATPSRKRQNKRSKEVDSDEEMRQVRRAIEQKHRSMLGTGNMAHGGGRAAGRGQKRGREDGNYKSWKKSRKTI